MKYPHIIFFRYEKYSYMDNFMLEFQDEYDLTIGITHELKDLNNLFSSNYHLLITFGEDKEEYRKDIFSILPQRFEHYWLHYEDFTNFKKLNKRINRKYVRLLLNREISRPTFSIFTTCYNSYEKILRAYNSLKKQTFLDWEWVIIDDSPDDKHFAFLREHFLCDKRIRFFRNSENNGNIGNMKNQAVSLCRGKYVLEFDHDDEIVYDLLQDSVDIFEKDEEVGFIYTDFANIYENGDNFKYGGILTRGYGTYYMQKHENKWRYVYVTPNINNITLSYLVCCPNHARIWRKDVLLKIGNYSEYLYICDDYEILLKTALNTKIVKLNKLGYIQYMNSNDNNFSLIRNSEINRIGPHHISPVFYKKMHMHDMMKLKNAYEDPIYITNHSNLWTRKKPYQHLYCNEVINPDYDKQFCIIGIETLLSNIEYYKEQYQNLRNDFILLDNKITSTKLSYKLDSLDFDRMKCYSLLDNTVDEMSKYFHILYKSCENVDIMSDKRNNKHFPERYHIINQYANDKTKYLEIGIEQGGTFLNVNSKNKKGVDPDPKIENRDIIKKKSDDFFKDNRETFDIIFIDGMHQSEYVLNDINNSIRYLNPNGKIFIDDILPSNYNEQQKIPNKHYYENGILKYGEPWTGDIWKVVFYIMQNYREYIDFEIYFNSNYRGVLEISILRDFQIPVDKIEEINLYDYHTDFDEYIQLLVEKEPLLSCWM